MTNRNILFSGVILNSKRFVVVVVVFPLLYFVSREEYLPDI